VKDAAGEIVELRCTYDPATCGGDAPDGRRPKATLHWLSADHAIPAEVRLYDHLFSRPDPGADGRDLFADLNPDSETVLKGCLAERSLAETRVGETVQFERLGYFSPDLDSTPGHLVFNRTLTLKDTWAKLQAQGRQDTA
jgi:glutaminyl-tRNA synthetase